MKKFEFWFKSWYFDVEWNYFVHEFFAHDWKQKKFDKNCIFVIKIETIAINKIDVLIVKSINSIDKITIVTIIHRSTTFMFFVFIILFLIIILRIQFTIIRNINIAITIDNQTTSKINNNNLFLFQHFNCLLHVNFYV